MIGFPEVFEDQLRIADDLAARYADVSGDRNPIHLDAAYAQAQGMRGPILHGLCTASLLVAKCRLHLPHHAQLNRLRLRFAEPVYPLDEIKLAAKRREKNQWPAGSSHTYRLSCLNQHGKDVITNFETEWRSASAAKTNASNFSVEMKVMKPVRIEADKIQKFCALVGEPAKNDPAEAPPLFCNVYAFSALIQYATDVGLIPPEILAQHRRGASKKIPQVIHASQSFDFFKATRAGESIVTGVKVDQERLHRGKRLIYFSSESRNEHQEMISSGRWFFICDVPQPVIL